ncbi:hypothetical protein FGO68_gene17612 [Halteria grandinella]|uniref:Uncharacterized protein n=1 Tax=Halteria grandinella TaxID=5974 RepID=A0A8J8NUL5_HALGN|nr:hypothetical protein FGO68_gene17612 [Halteria grandinella]
MKLDVAWAITHMKSIQFEKLWEISLNGYVTDKEEFVNTVFGGPLRKCRRKKLITQEGNKFGFSYNEVLTEPDTATQEFHSQGCHAIKTAIFALNNCQYLTKLCIECDIYEIHSSSDLQIRIAYLKELRLSNFQKKKHILFAEEIIKRCKDTLTSLYFSSCDETDLKPLKFSKALTHLAIENCSLDTLEVIATLEQLQHLETENKDLLELVKAMKSLKSLKYSGSNLNCANFKFPSSLTSLHFQESIRTAGLKTLLQIHPLIREVTLPIPSKRHQVAELLIEYKNIKFNFTYNHNVSQSMSFIDDFNLLYPKLKEQGDIRPINTKFQSY